MSTVQLPAKRPRPTIPDAAIDSAARKTGFDPQKTESAPNVVNAGVVAPEGQAPVLARPVTESAGQGGEYTRPIKPAKAKLRDWGKRDGPVIAVRPPERLDHALRLLAAEKRVMPSKLILDAIIEYLERRDRLPPGTEI